MITPTEFLTRTRTILTVEDVAKRHIMRDNLWAEALIALGYEDSIDAWDGEEVWYE